MHKKNRLDGCSPISVYINVSIKCMQQRRSHMVGAVAAVVGWVPLLPHVVSCWRLEPRSWDRVASSLFWQWVLLASALKRNGASFHFKKKVHILKIWMMEKSKWTYAGSMILCHQQWQRYWRIERRSWNYIENHSLLPQENACGRTTTETTTLPPSHGSRMPDTTVCPCHALFMKRHDSSLSLWPPSASM